MQDSILTRRTMMRRLAAIGLVAAGSGALVVSDTDAKGKRNSKGKSNGKRGHGKNRHEGKDRDRRGSEQEPSEIDPDEDNPREDATPDLEPATDDPADEGEPTTEAVEGRNGKRRKPQDSGGVDAEAVTPPRIVSPKLTIRRISGSADAEVKVTATILFDRYHLDEIRRGLGYAVTCDLMEDDDVYKRLFSFWKGAESSNIRQWFRFQNLTNPPASKAMTFTQRVPRSRLNEDDSFWTQNYQDEIIAQLHLRSSTRNTTSLSAWPIVKYVYTNKWYDRF
jgi:hypothetical protein